MALPLPSGGGKTSRPRLLWCVFSPLHIEQSLEVCMHLQPDMDMDM